MCVSTDDRMRNGEWWARIKRSAGLGLLSTAVVGSITPFAAQSADDLKLPASFRNWYHVNTMVIDKGSPLFQAMGGMHNVYINASGEAALKKGQPYPDKTEFLVDLHEFTCLSDGSYAGRSAEADRHHAEGHEEVSFDRRLGFPGLGGEVIQKAIGHRTQPNNASECHQPKKRPRLRAYSTYIP